MKAFDVQVSGAGIVGKSLALSLAGLGLSVALRSRPAQQGAASDVRAYALSPTSISLLRRLKVWDALAADATTAVHDMIVRGDTGDAELEFSAWQQCVAELAVITDAAALDQEFDHALRFAAHVMRVDTDVPAALVAHCEGRAGAGAALGETTVFERNDYGQRAIAARLVATLPHRHTARQWFRSPDVLALLPFDRPEPGRSYALVWSLPNERADALLAMDATAFEHALAEAAGADVGTLALASARASWPLIVAAASKWSGPGWVLVGDAAHVVHPLAGQGLNLGLADVVALTAVIAGRESWRGVGDERLLRRYGRQRAAPTWAMRQMTDGLLRLFATPSAPIRELRNNGMSLVNRVPPLKRWLTARALDS
ncbi:MAG TPA: FAD-dependent monooxygenase [Caldimonas sp.]|nr:FAD-dependent monooxygenase [Caldimonas sp.]HEX4234233.1 FAD-dependent monooxygenase [Caldimonas sp.]